MTFFYGWQRDLPDFRDLSDESETVSNIFKNLKAPLKATPTNVDLRQWCSPIENQLQLGSCFHPNTKVKLLNGEIKTLKQLSKYKEPFWVYSCTTDGKIVPGKATCQLTGENKNLIRITLDNKEKIICTSDHEFLLRNGIYKKAEDLTSEDSLMPLYTKLSDKGYELVFDHFFQKYSYTHWVVAREFQHEAIKVASKNKVIHHADFNKKNNNPDNLQLMGWIQHRDLHSKLGSENLLRWNGSEKQREHSRKIMNDRYARDAKWNIENCSRGGKKAQAGFFTDNPDILKSCLKLGHSKESRRKANISIKITKSKPEYKQKCSALSIQKFKDGLLKNFIEASRKNVGENSTKLQVIKLGKKLIEKYNCITKENWEKERPKFFPKYETASKYFESIEEFKCCVKNYNHKICKIEVLNKTSNVYCLTVEKYHNFALNSGVFVHNCTANAGVGLLEYFEKKAFGKFTNASRLFLYKTTRNLMKVTGDTGATIRLTMKAMVLFGMPPEEYLPYDITKFDAEPAAFHYAFADSYKSLVYYKLDPVGTKPEQILQNVKDKLAIGLPSMFGFTVYSSLGSSAMIPFPTSKDVVRGGHAVLCFTGDTKISLLNGEEISLKEAHDKFKNKHFWVYSCDENKKIVAGKAHSVRKTGVNQKILAITLDNNETIKCTPSHLFLMRNGTYKEAQYLKENDSLMPLYRQFDVNGYEQVLQPYSNNWQYTHRAVMASVVDSYPKKTVVHHSDFNKKNNDVNNLQFMSWDDHTILHTSLITNYNKSEKGRLKSSQTMKKNWNNPEWKEKALIRCRENFKKGRTKTNNEKRSGFHTLSVEARRINIKKSHKFMSEHPEVKKIANQKQSETFKTKFQNNVNFAESVKKRAIKNLQHHNYKISTGLKQNTEKQINARRNNALKLHENKELMKKAQLKTTWKRFYQDKFENFEEFLLNFKPKKTKAINHKVLKIENAGYEDVYDLTVDKYHNFALSSGVFVHNCVGFSDDMKIGSCTGALLVRNSWGTSYGDRGYCWLPYQYVLSGLAVDFWTLVKASYLDSDLFV